MGVVFRGLDEHSEDRIVAFVLQRLLRERRQLRGGMAIAEEAYQLQETEAQREALVRRYLPLVRYHVNRLGANPPPPLERSDLVSYGVIGLLEAATRFDPSRGADFAAFASARIRGAILDALRQAHWAPRGLADKLRQVGEALKRLQGDGPVSDQEVAKVAGLTLQEYYAALEQGTGALCCPWKNFVGCGWGRRPERGELLVDEDSPTRWLSMNGTNYIVLCWLSWMNCRNGTDCC